MRGTRASSSAADGEGCSSGGSGECCRGGSGGEHRKSRENTKNDFFFEFFFPTFFFHHSFFSLVFHLGRELGVGFCSLGRSSLFSLSPPALNKRRLEQAQVVLFDELLLSIGTNEKSSRQTLQSEKCRRRSPRS